MSKEGKLVVLWVDKVTWNADSDITQGHHLVPTQERSWPRTAWRLYKRDLHRHSQAREVASAEQEHSMRGQHSLLTSMQCQARSPQSKDHTSQANTGSRQRAQK